MVDRDALSPVVTPAARKRGIRTSVCLVGSLLFVAAPPAVFAAATLGDSCNGSVTRALKSAEIAVEALTVDVVDYASENPGAFDPVVGHAQDPTAPLLFLTPRVAHILEDVFDDAGAADTEARLTERVPRLMLVPNAAARTQTPQQPAEEGSNAAGGAASEETATDFDTAISSGALPETFYDADTLPRFQRRMYRTDI